MTDGLEDAIAAATALHAEGRLDAAESAWRSVLDSAPDHAGVRHNLGVVLAEQGRTEEALAMFESAIAIEPAYAAAHFNRANALNALGRLEAAAAAYGRTAALEPDHYAAHRALGFLWMALARRDRALDHFARTLELRRGDDRGPIAVDSLRRATRGKLEHDAAQFRHIADRVRDRPRWQALARTYDAVAAEVPDGPPVTLTDNQLDLLGESYNTAFHLRAAPELAGATVNPARTVADLDGIAVIDDLLTADALAALRRFLLESTVWHDFTHIDGFLASYLEDGLASPLFLQIADDIRAAFPAQLGPHPLTQGWAFKGIRGDLPIDVHADDAAWTVNFWVTPDAANADPATGGLAVWTTPPPADWKITGYEADSAGIRDFLAEHAGARQVVPYCENRAVLFASRLFHGSDAPDFRPGYENMRINITLLFGSAAI